MQDIHLFSPNKEYNWEIWRKKNTITCNGHHLLDSDLDGGYYTLIKVIQETCDILKKHKRKKHIVKIILLSCPGGDMPIIDITGVMALCKYTDPKLKFKLYCMGEISSAATIWMSAIEWDKIYLYSKSRYIIHPPYIVLNEGASVDLLNYRSTGLTELTERMADIYAVRSHMEGKDKTREFFMKLIKKSSRYDKLITAIEMIDMGLGSKIY